MANDFDALVNDLLGPSSIPVTPQPISSSPGMRGEFDTLVTDLEQPQSQPITSVQRNPVMDIPTAAVAGLTDLAELYARAYQGSDVPGSELMTVEGQVDPLNQFANWLIQNKDKFEKEHPYIYAPAEGEGTVRKWFREGARAVVPSLGASVPSAIVGSAIGGPVGAVTGYVGGGATIFGLSEYNRFLHDVQKYNEENPDKAVPAEIYQNNAIKSAIFEGGLEGLNDLIEAATFKVGGLLTKPMKSTIKDILGQGLKESTKAYVKGQAVLQPSEMLTEAAQNYSETALRNEIGIDDTDPKDAALTALGPTFFSTLIMGTGAHALNVRQNSKIAKALENPETDFDARFDAMRVMYKELKKQDKVNGTNFAETWGKVAQYKLLNKEGINITETLSEIKPVEAILKDKAVTEQLNTDVAKFDERGKEKIVEDVPLEQPVNDKIIVPTGHTLETRKVIYDTLINKGFGEERANELASRIMGAKEVPVTPATKLVNTGILDELGNNIQKEVPLDSTNDTIKLSPGENILSNIPEGLRNQFVYKHSGGLFSGPGNVKAILKKQGLSKDYAPLLIAQGEWIGAPISLIKMIETMKGVTGKTTPQVVIPANTKPTERAEIPEQEYNNVQPDDLSNKGVPFTNKISAQRAIIRQQKQFNAPEDFYEIVNIGDKQFVARPKKLVKVPVKIETARDIINRRNPEYLEAVKVSDQDGIKKLDEIIQNLKDEGHEHTPAYKQTVQRREIINRRMVREEKRRVKDEGKNKGRVATEKQDIGAQPQQIKPEQVGGRKEGETGTVVQEHSQAPESKTKGTEVQGQGKNKNVVAFVNPKQFVTELYSFAQGLFNGKSTQEDYDTLLDKYNFTDDAFISTDDSLMDAGYTSNWYVDPNKVYKLLVSTFKVKPDIARSLIDQYNWVPDVNKELNEIDEVRKDIRKKESGLTIVQGQGKAKQAVENLKAKVKEKEEQVKEKNLKDRLTARWVTARLKLGENVSDETVAKFKTVALRWSRNPKTGKWEEHEPGYKKLMTEQEREKKEDIRNILKAEANDRRKETEAQAKAPEEKVTDITKSQLFTPIEETKLNLDNFTVLEPALDRRMLRKMAPVNFPNAFRAMINHAIQVNDGTIDFVMIENFINQLETASKAGKLDSSFDTNVDKQLFDKRLGLVKAHLEQARDYISKHQKEMAKKREQAILDHKAQRAAEIEEGIKPLEEEDNEPFARINNPSGIQTLSVPQVQGIINTFKDRWINQPSTIIVKDRAELLTIADETLEQYIKETPDHVRMGGVLHHDTIFLIADELINRDDVIKTMIHEMVGHYGVAKTLGPEFNEVCVNVFNKFKDTPLMKKLINDYDHYNPNERQGQQGLGAEFIAKMSEDKAYNPTFWEYLIQEVKRILNNIFGTEFTLPDNQIRALIMESNKFIEGKKDYGKVEDYFETPVHGAQESPVPWAYSALLKGVQDNLKLMPAKVQSLRKWLEKFAKPEEMKWMGVEQFFGNKLIINKDEFLDFLKSNQIELKEIHRSDTTAKDESTQYTGFLDDVPNDEGLYEVYIYSPGGTEIYHNETFEDYEVGANYLAEELDELNQNLADTGGFIPDTPPDVENDMREDQYQNEATTFIDNLYDTLRGQGVIGTTTLDGFRDHAFDEFVEPHEISIDNLSAYLEGTNISQQLRNDFLTQATDINLRHEGINPEPVPVKWASWQVPGGENYREMQLIYNPGKKLPLKDVIKEGGRPSDVHETAYQSSHWNEPNVLAHIRWNERTDDKGNKILFIEEIQSDWLQAAKHEGFIQTQGDLTAKAIPNENKPGTFWGAVIDQNGNYVTKMGEEHGDDPVSRDEALSWANYQIDNLAEMGDITAKGKGVHKAPFLENWDQLCMKRMIRYAAENGFDGITWTTGEQQIQRYESALRKHVKEIKWTTLTLQEYGEGTPGKLKAVKVIEHNGNENTLKVNSDGIISSGFRGTEGHNIAEVVGKELAIKIMSKGTGSISGLDIKIGGKGMKVAYDERLPNFVSKYIKQWNAKLEKINLGEQDETIKEWRWETMDDGEYSLMTEDELFRIERDRNKVHYSLFVGEIGTNDETHIGNFRTLTEAKDKALAYYNHEHNISNKPLKLKLNQPGFYFTPEMKHDVIYKGQPLWNKQGIDQTKLLQDIEQKFDTTSGFVYGAGILLPSGNSLSSTKMHEDLIYDIQQQIPELKSKDMGTILKLLKGIRTRAFGKDDLYAEIPLGIKPTEAQYSTIERALNKETGSLTYDIVNESNQTIMSSGVVNTIDEFKRIFTGQGMSDVARFHAMGDVYGRRIVDFQDATPETSRQELKDLFSDEAYALLKTMSMQLPKNLPSLTWAERYLLSPEFYSHPTLEKIVKAAIERHDRYYEIFNELNNIDHQFNGEDNIIDLNIKLKYKGINFTGKNITDKVSSEWQQFEKMQDEIDTGEWRQNYGENDQTTWEQHYRIQGVPDEVIELYKLHRTAYDNALNLLITPMQTLVTEIERVAQRDNTKPKYPMFTTLDEQGQPIKISLKEVINRMGQLRGTYAPRIREIGNYVIKGKRFEKVVRYHKSNRVEAEVLKRELERKGYKVENIHERERLPEDVYASLRIINTQKAIETAMKGMQEKELDTELLAKFNEELIRNVADLVRMRGFRSSMIARGKGEVVRGYITDPNERFVRYINNIAAGVAKGEAAKKMFGLIAGEYQGEGKDRKKIGGIDPSIDHRAYDTATKYIEEQLRNTDTGDRIIGLVKSIATFKYLGLNPRSPVVNVLSLVTTVPMAMHTHALEGKGSMIIIGKELAKAANDYVNIMRGKKLTNKDEQAYMDEIKRKGYDTPQYTRDALGTIQRAHGKAWAKTMYWSMYIFGKSEQWIRGTTMLASYRLLKSKNKGMSEVDLRDKAHFISNRAHGVYGKSTQLAVGQGTGPGARLAQLLYTYQKFGHTYIQALYEAGVRKGNIKGFLYGLMSPIILSGIAVVPFKDFWWKLIGIVLSILGIKDDPEKGFWDWVRKKFGNTTERVGRHGLLGAANLDVSSSMSIGVGVPRNFYEMFGVGGGILNDYIQAKHFLEIGNTSRAIEKTLPTGVGNFIRAVRELNGATTLSGARVWDENGNPYMPSTGETAARVLGFRSAELATMGERTWETKREIKSYSTEHNDILEAYRNYLVSKGSQEDFQEIMARIVKYNQDVISAGKVNEVPLIKYETLKRQAKQLTKPSKSIQAGLFQQ